MKINKVPVGREGDYVEIVSPLDRLGVQPSEERQKV